MIENSANYRVKRERRQLMDKTANSDDVVFCKLSKYVANVDLRSGCLDVILPDFDSCKNISVYRHISLISQVKSRGRLQASRRGHL